MLPAYAGMIPYVDAPVTYARGAPRVCGDDPHPYSQALATSLCSPRMRG